VLNPLRLEFMWRRTRSALLLFLALLMAAFNCAAQYHLEYYMDPQGVSKGTCGNGTSPCASFAALNSSMDPTIVGGSVRIHVGPGNYSVGNDFGSLSFIILE